MAYLKASSPGMFDDREANASVGTAGNQADASLDESGAVYVFTR